MHTIGDIKGELAWLYRRALNGGIPWPDATKAAHVLGLIARLIEGHELEARLARLEEELLPAGKTNGHAHQDHAPRY